MNHYPTSYASEFSEENPLRFIIEYRLTLKSHNNLYYNIVCTQQFAKNPPTTRVHLENKHLTFKEY